MRREIAAEAAHCLVHLMSAGTNHVEALHVAAEVDTGFPWLPCHLKRSRVVIDLKQYRVWFVTGSQHLYGPETLKQVAADAEAVAQGLAGGAAIPVTIQFKRSSPRPSPSWKSAGRPTLPPPASA